MRPTKRARLRVAAPVTLAAVIALALAAGTAAAAPPSHGQLLRPAHAATLNANQSNNWFGYNQGSLEKGKQFHSIAGNWTVPTVSQHTAGQSEASSDWIGIGGGCVNANCTVTDNTLIQAGTEQDVDSSGQPTYDAWWEVIPGPEFVISNFPVGPGDQIHAQIAETFSGSNVWKITLRDITRSKTFTKTVAYSSTHATAEWIEETPLEIGTNAGLAPLPDLTNVVFDHAKTNGSNARLKAAEEMLLVDSSGNVIGTPSAPDSDTDGFTACTWATTCPVPAS